MLPMQQKMKFLRMIIDNVLLRSGWGLIAPCIYGAAIKNLLLRIILNNCCKSNDTADGYVA